MVDKSVQIVKHDNKRKLSNILRVRTSLKNARWLYRAFVKFLELWLTFYVSPIGERQTIPSYKSSFAKVVWVNFVNLP